MKDLLKMDLQYFAEDPEPDIDGAEDGQENPEDENPEEDKTVNVEEMKRRLDKQDEKHQKELKEIEKSFENKINEAEKLRKMNAEQKQEYEQEKKDNRIAELEAELNRNGLEREATSMLSEQGITANEYDLNLVVGEDADETQKLVENYAQRIEELADKKLEEYKRGSTPRKSGGSTPVSAEEIRNIKDPKERIAAIRNNKKLFK